MDDAEVKDSSDSCKTRYSRLEKDREPYLLRARECALYTIPSLFPPLGSNGTTKLYSPFQSLGARGINTLSAKLVLTLLPPNSPFYREVLSDALVKELTGRDDVRGKIEESLSAIEREVMSEIETSALRAPVYNAFRQLLIAGNYLFMFPPKGAQKGYRLDRYVVVRDPSGNLLEVITCEDIAPEIAEASFPKGQSDEQLTSSAGGDNRKTVELYTRGYLEDGTWNIYQEINGREVPGSRWTRPSAQCPFMALRFMPVEGEDYGRGYAEEYIGDLKSLEGLSKAIVQGSAAAAKVLFLVRPNSTTSMKALSQSETGDVREGNAEDVSTLQMEKHADFRVAKETIDSLKESLSFAFMLNTAIQRNGERVTAEEIRYMANELESSLGGIYSSLAQDFQMRLLVVIKDRLQRAGRIPRLPGVKAVPITGLEAIGRGQDRVKLAGFIRDVTETLGPEVAAPYLNVAEFITRMGASWSIDTKGLINDEQTMQANQQSAQLQELIKTLGPNAVTQLGGMAKQQMQNSAEAPAGAPAGTQ